MNSLTDFKPLSVSQRVEWHDKGKLNHVVNLDLFASMTTRKIVNYVESQIKDFLEENKISVKNWNKRGIIQEMPPEIGCKSYILYFKTWRKEFKKRITVEYNLII